MLTNSVYVDAKDYGFSHKGSNGNTIYVPLGRAPKLKEVFDKKLYQ